MFGELEKIRDERVKKHSEIGSYHHLVLTEITVNTKNAIYKGIKGTTIEKIRSYNLIEEILSKSIYQQEIKPKYEHKIINK